MIPNRTALIAPPLFLLAALACISCSAEPDTGPSGPQRLFRCADNSWFAVREGGDEAVVERPTMIQVRLTAQPAASGKLYEGGGYALRLSDDEAVWTEANGLPMLCRATSRS